MVISKFSSIHKPWLKGILISVAIIPHHFLMFSRVVCIVCIEIKLLFNILLNTFSIWNLRLLESSFILYVNFSDFTPFIRLWIVFLDWITKIFIYVLISKLANISYRDMQNLSSPSDCIQFPVSDNERMITSWIIHISDSWNSTVNWSWGIETQTGF